jgi:ATP-dependent helicase/nuclease subunit B
LVEAFWRPHFQRFARWFAGSEPGRRANAARILTEVDGALDLATGRGFRLTARADRIDVAADGSVVIYDYKTGKPPSQKHVDELFAPQLPLEAAIAEEGGFADLGKREVNGLVYISASGRHEGDAAREAGNKGAADLAKEARDKLSALIVRYNDPDMAYEVKRRRGPFANSYRYDEYEHLARVKEWLTQEAEEDFR